MKVGILSFQSAINYGGILQIYAMQQHLKKMNITPIVINYENKSIKKSNKLKRQVNLPERTNLRLLKMIYLKIAFRKNKKSWERKYIIFQEFKKKHLNLSGKAINNLNSETINSFDAYILGSDQIWNPNITDGFDPIFFGDFESEGKKIAYSASCGSIKTLDHKEREFFDLIKKLDHLATREKELLNYIENSTELKGTHTIDPTLLLDKEDYDIITERPNLRGKYILIYKLQENSEIYKAAKSIAKNRSLEIVEIGFKPFKTVKGITYLETEGPKEFLGLIENAQFVITNSFHGTVFSIIFEKEFLTIPHKSVGQRMVELLTSLNLNERLITEFNEEMNKSLVNINYKLVKEDLKLLRKKSITYLTESLNV